MIVLLGAPIAAQGQSQSPGSPPAPAQAPVSSVPPPLPDLPGRRGEIIKPDIPAPSEGRGRSLLDPRCGLLLESQRQVTPGCQ